MVPWLAGKGDGFVKLPRWMWRRIAFEETAIENVPETGLPLPVWLEGRQWP
jgi:hypothetical protein